MVAPLWADRTRPELERCACLDRGVAESVGLSCPTQSLGRGEVPAGLGALELACPEWQPRDWDTVQPPLPPPRWRLRLSGDS